jgi:hypothetical protein
MTSESEQTNLPDGSRINVDADYEILYWTARLHCTARQLREAVAAVGTRVGDVRAYLRELTH